MQWKSRISYLVKVFENGPLDGVYLSVLTVARSGMAVSEEAATGEESEMGTRVDCTVFVC